MPELGNARILEIGWAGVYKRLLPEQTRFFSTARRMAARRAGLDRNDISSLVELMRILQAGDFDIIVCMPSQRSPWHWQTISRLLGSRHVLADLRRPLRHFGPQLLRFYRDPCLVVVDFDDTPYIERDNFFLMDAARLYFKRELPVDEWRLLTKTASDTLPSRRLRRSRLFRERLDKVMPISIGLPFDVEADLPVDMPAKETDIFFAGTVQGVPARERAQAELAKLREEGFVIDIPDQPIPRKEFYRRSARAWLTLSPEGLGWDCFRHYEAAACGSVPLINTPSIRRHKPLLDGKHAIFYEVEHGFLSSRVRGALADKDRLMSIANAGRAHVLANHTKKALLSHIVETALALPSDPSAWVGFGTATG